MEKLIKYKNKEILTKHWCELSDEEFNKIRDEYYKKPDFIDVNKEFVNLYKGGTKHSNITNYYVKDLMSKVLIYYNKWSIEDVLNNKDLTSFFVEKTRTNNKVYPQSNSLIKNIETAFRLGGKGVCSKPSNFPLNTVDEILKKYNVNNYWYDFSCGWGDRLLGSLKNKVNYFGTDPNYLLVERLKNMAIDYKKANNLSRGIIDIKACGSEIFNPEWKNKFGLAFSSPPYFYLEDYKIGNQSYKEGTSYVSWKENYLRPTIHNIYIYIIDNGYFLLNINNFKNYNLIEDTKQIAIEEGFKFKEYYQLKNIKRCKSIGGVNDNSEKIMVFTK